ncbi:MAG TPA: hypothetical protein VJ901_05755 [Thermoanaerobaculia bacterium]|nr:hypothetical protein [Thermoanaerobaculia bacterium]
MFKRITVVLATMLLASSSFAQDAGDIEQRLKALQEKVAAIDELKKEIDVLTQEIERMKTAPAAVTENAASEPGPGVSIGGYGEFRYENPKHGEPTADFVRGVIYAGYKFNPRVHFNSELEVEHASTELNGAVSLEFAQLDYLVRPEFNVRGGVLLMPVGIINEQHEPTTYLASRRPLVEDVIIPTTWSEIGAGVFGDVGRVSYRSYITTGMSSTRFESEEGIHEGKQSGSEAGATDLAIVARADFHPFEGTMFGGSVYQGGSGQGAGFKGRVRLAELHADSKFRGVSLRALVARGSVGDAALINEQNGLSGDASIGKTFGGWYTEAGYDVLKSGAMSLTPYFRYESLDTQRSVPLGFERNPENDRRIWTFGMAFKPISQTVVKIDYEKARRNDNQWNIALGYIF